MLVLRSDGCLVLDQLKFGRDRASRQMTSLTFSAFFHASEGHYHPHLPRRYHTIALFLLTFCTFCLSFEASAIAK
jgi:hypothetical protein